MLSVPDREYESVLKSMKYPFISGDTTEQTPKPSSDRVSRLQALTKHLLRLHNPPAALAATPLRPPTPLTTDTNPPAGPNTDTSHRTSEDSSALLNRSSSTSNPDSHNESLQSVDSYSSACSSPRRDGQDEPAIVADFAPLVTPLQLLLKPLEVSVLDIYA